MAKFLEEHKLKGYVCPCCGKDDGVDGHEVEINGTTAEQNCGCFNCDAEWIDHYTLENTSIVREAKK